MLRARLLTYDIRIPDKIKGLCKYLSFSDKIVLGVVVTNLIVCGRKGFKMVYTRDTSKVAVNTKRRIKTRHIIKCIEFLEQEGYIINTIGTASKNEEHRLPSFATPTEKFMQKFMTDEDIEQYYLQATESVVLRNREKKEQEFKMTEDVAKMKALVVELNTLNSNHDIRDGEGQPLSNVYTRIFNESFDYGGRFYRADILQIKNKDDSQRLDVTIDGKPVVEVDFQNLHIRIAAVLEEIDLDEIPLDMYAYVLDDPRNKVDRKIVKLAINILFNCPDMRTAKQAIQSEINSLEPEDKEKYTLGHTSSVVALIEQRYPEFMYLFCQEDC